MKRMTDEELRERLGEYFAPEGLYRKTKDMPFLGRVTCNTDTLTAGEWTGIVLDYEVGAAGMADGAWFKATFKFYSDWALFQTADPAGANYVSAEYQAGPCVPGQSPATVQSLKVRFDQKGHERPFQKAIIVDTVDGYLKPGDHIVLRLGDRRFGGPGTRVQTFVEKGFRFRCYCDPLGTSRFAAVAPDLCIDVVPGRPEAIEMAASRIVRRGAAFPLRVRTEDAWGNTCWNTGGIVDVTAALDGRPVYERAVELAPEGWATALIDDLPAGEAGELAVTARLRDAPRVGARTFYVTVDEAFAYARNYFGDLHVHSDDTVGTNDTRYNLTYGRDVAGLDVLGYTANDFNVTKERWDKAVALIHALNRPGTFVCYPGTEWCGSSCAGGDHNVVFLRDGDPEFPFDRHGNVCRSFEWNEDMASDTIEPGAWPLEELWATYIHDPEGHLLMPHVGGRRCILDWHHPVLERLVEIGSAWGHFPWLYEEAMRRGYKLGAAANGDEHRGRCGGGVPGTAVFGTRGGVTGILADALDRASVGAALRARHTFATTGERIAGLASCAGQLQGDEFEHSGPARIRYRFLGDRGFDEIVAVDHTGIIRRRNLQKEAGFSERRIRVSWGGARIRDRYRWAEWKGRITVVNGVVNHFEGRGFEHAEEACWRESATTLGFRSDTYGDTDCIEMDVSDLEKAAFRIEGTIDGYAKVGNPLEGNPFAHCPAFEFHFTGADLLARGRIHKALGGAELFVGAERLSDRPMPRDVSGELEIEAENASFGFRPVYLMARQIDDAKVWTSAMFITFR